MEESVSAESVSDLKTAKFGIQKTRTSQYVFEYKNVWDPVKKRSKPLYRISVGKIIGGEVVIKDEYLQMHPELKQGDIVLQEGKPVYIGRATAPSELFEILELDHFCLTTAQPEAMVSFYRLLGLKVRKEGERYEIEFPHFKINLHVIGYPILPEAKVAVPGTGDFCLEIKTGSDLSEIAEAFRRLDIFVEGPVIRHGRKGEMTSVYLRDPDQNLVELAAYPKQ